MTTQPQTPEQAKCEWCGADYDPTTRPPTPPHPEPASKDITTAEPTTHCEWCGAEYPHPGVTRPLSPP